MAIETDFGNSVMAEQAHGAEESQYVPATRKDLQRYMENVTLAKQMGVYFYQLCEARKAMGKKKLTELLNEARKERLDKLAKLKETRGHDKRKDRSREGR